MFQCHLTPAFHSSHFRDQKVRMPKPKHKKNAFIDKKASTSFHLVHRSQKVYLDFFLNRQSYLGKSFHVDIETGSHSGFLF